MCIRDRYMGKTFESDDMQGPRVRRQTSYIIDKNGKMKQVSYMESIRAKMKKLTAYCDLRLTTIRNYILIFFDMEKSQDNRLNKAFAKRLGQLPILRYLKHIKNPLDAERSTGNSEIEIFISHDLNDFRGSCLKQLQKPELANFQPLEENCIQKVDFILNQGYGKLKDKNFVQQYGEPMILACSSYLNGFIYNLVNKSEKQMSMERYKKKIESVKAVSYTHLTLPTIYSV
eukprot:TRINITY_DN20314_c0_g1_i1.p1 TRINITY_DN20314_c0_g1~~TRINITY_DN20314_c0_g1_i1.p1  ORF type:complete len:250 (+),score=48.21 TRINITY_DN20314_c0_g1_i1:61-750(+)